jgi:hypothetical protein
VNATTTQDRATRVAGSNPMFIAMLGAALALFVGTIAPAAAGAAEVNVSTTPGFTGWAYVKLPTCAPSAWRWSGDRWTQGVRTQGEYVYVTPYQAGWYWSWRHYSGWQIIPASHLVMSDRPLAENTCGWPGVS